MIGIVARPYSAWCRLEEVIPSLVELILILVIQERISVALERAYKRVDSVLRSHHWCLRRSQRLVEEVRETNTSVNGFARSPCKRNWSIPDGSRCH